MEDAQPVDDFSPALGLNPILDFEHDDDVESEPTADLLVGEPAPKVARIAPMVPSGRKADTASAEMVATVKHELEVPATLPRAPSRAASSAERTDTNFIEQMKTTIVFQQQQMDHMMAAMTSFTTAIVNNQNATRVNTLPAGAEAPITLHTGIIAPHTHTRTHAHTHTRTHTHTHTHTSADEETVNQNFWGMFETAPRLRIEFNIL